MRLKNPKIFQRFCRYIIYNSSRDLIRPLERPKGFEWLIAYAKYNHNSYKSELDFNCFVLLEDEQSLGVGVLGLDIYEFYTSFYLDLAPNS